MDSSVLTDGVIVTANAMLNTTTIQAQPRTSMIAYSAIGADGIDHYGLERPGSIFRKIVEGLFYLMVLNSVFIYKTGLILIPYLAGGLNTGTAIIALFVMVALEGQRLPTTIWFVVIINIAANLSMVLSMGETPVIGLGLPLLTHWMSLQLIMCLLVQNRGAQKRLIVFFSMLLVVLMAVGQETYGGKGAAKRAGVGEEFGGTFSNTNSLA